MNVVVDVADGVHGIAVVVGAADHDEVDVDDVTVAVVVATAVAVVVVDHYQS